MAKTNGKSSLVKNVVTKVTQRVNNEFTMLRGWFWKNFLDPARRDLDRECGYPAFVVIEQYRQMYDREGIGTKVVNFWPDECWKNHPEIYEKEDETEKTEFEKAWDEIDKKFNLYSFLHRIDRMSGIGYYGLMVLGLDDKKELNEPVAGINPETGEKVGDVKHKLLYVRCFDESQCLVSQFETDKKKPRFGQPIEYSIRFSDPLTESVPGGQATIQGTVHWTRVIHIADNRTTSEVFGVPRMRPVWNRLCDIRKLLGSSAEMFYKGGFPGYSFEIDPKLADIDLDIDKTRQEAQELQEGLSRISLTQGMQVKSLAPQVASPKDHFDIQITAICIQIDAPKRIFMGSEQGELASGQDKGNWNGRVAGRQNRYVTPFIIRIVVDRLMLLGCIPTVDEYFVDWPDLDVPSDSDKAAVCLQRTQALVQFTESTAVNMITEEDYLSRYQGFTTAEAAAMIAAAAKRPGFEGGLAGAKKEQQDLENKVMLNPPQRQGAEQNTGGPVSGGGNSGV